MKKGLTILLIISSLFSFSTVRIVVDSSTYVNQNILFYRYADYVTKSIDTLAFVKTNVVGALDAKIELNDLSEVFVDLGFYKGVVFMSPNIQEYRLKLPKYRKKTKVDLLNPFFKPSEIHLLVENEAKFGLNKLIASFDNIYNEFVIRNFDSIHYRKGYRLITQFEKDMSAYYSESSDIYFEMYRKFKIDELKFLSYNRSFRVMTQKYLEKNRVEYNNPAYMSLFNLLYDNFFPTYNATAKGKQLKKVVEYARSPQKFKKMLRSDFLNNDTLASLILLKGIHDELFYSKKVPKTLHLPRPQLLIMLDSVADYGIAPQNREIAQNIKRKYQQQEQLSKEKFDGFVLENQLGEKVDLKKFRGKYVYLNIVQTDVLKAMENMDRLIGFNKKHQDDIEIVSIFIDDDIEAFKKISSKKYPWTLLHIGDNKKLLKQLRFVVAPQFHLINPYGKLIWTPASSLEEGFAQKFFKILDSRS